MAKTFQRFAVLLSMILLLLINSSEQLQSSQGQTLLRIQRLLNYPSVLSSWNSSTDFCNTEPNPSVTVVCYGESITQIHIIGNKGATALPKHFSIDSFVTTLVSLSEMKVLTLVSLGLWGPLPGKIARFSSLEILNMSSNFLYDAIPGELSSLSRLQTIVLDDNMLSGELPSWISKLPVLAVLSLRKNMFNGSLPHSFSNLESLRVLTLSYNYFHGDLPDFSSLTNLQVLDLGDNAFGPQFPKLGNKLITLVLSKNQFRAGLPADMSSYYQLQRLDLSRNNFVGPFLLSLISLPSITYLNVADNKLTGMLPENQSCSSELKFVDLSSNLLTGNLPTCLLPAATKKVLYAGNCLANGDQDQYPLSLCRNEALAVGVFPHQRRRKETSKVIMALCIIGGIVGGAAIFVVSFLAIRKIKGRKTIKKPTTRLISENASIGYPSKLLSDARYISQTMKLGALGLPAYRTFSLEELEEATNNFDTSSFMGEGSQGQMYRGQLKDGSFVAIRCLKMKRSHSTQNFVHHIELISKLRHRNLVSALGHCFECYLDDSSVSRVFLVFEYVPNGTLRSWVSVGRASQKPNWSQRIAAAIGVAKGIQFLHNGIVPGVYSNNLKITDVLLDQNLVAKISSYNLPLLAENTEKVGHGTSSGGSKDLGLNARIKQEEKLDVYDFGVILLELIFGRLAKSGNEVDALKNQLRTSITSDDAASSTVDPALFKACSDQSLKTIVEICIRCLHETPEDRPSVEDLLWNLQFAAQVQDAWRGDSHSSEGSPDSTSQPWRLQLTIS